MERRAREPIIPLRLFRERTVVLAVIASIAVGIAMFGTTVFLTQYMQIARGMSPTESGLLTIPMVFGLFGASITIGRIVSRTGVYKRWMLTGAALLTDRSRRSWARSTSARASSRSAPSCSSSAPASAC